MARGGRGGGGRGRGRGNFSRGSGGGRPGQWGNRRANVEIERSNAQFEAYYNSLGIVGEEERDRFWSSTRTDLPASFRFTGSRSHALTVKRRLVDHYIPEIGTVQFEGRHVEPPKPIQWYPDQLAWSMTTPKNVIRRFPPFASFQKFLVSENSVGNITRQEIVSMIPPLMMDLKPGMTALDMCAAPGSKSVQMIEAIHGGEEGRVRKVLASLLKSGEREGSPGAIGYAEEAEMQQAGSEGDYADDGRATGLLIANDREYKRAQMLIHQCKRINSPNLIVTNHDATLYPSLKLPKDPKAGTQRYLKFDRILADVPCSGDGTARKNLDVWREWNIVNGLGLHVQQTRILVRALQMLKVGGRVVYSTCSLNPIEDEAVVAEAISRSGGIDKVTLVDTNAMLPGLERREGLRDWEVADRKATSWSSWSEVEAARAANPRGEAAGKVTESMFPPPPEAEVPLHRCVRVYPHLQDTGGFFIAVLEKRTEIRVRPENEPSSQLRQPNPTDAAEAPISSIVNELANQSDDAARRGDRISAADAAVPETSPLGLNESRGPPVERQNSLDGPAKRSLEIDGTTDALSPPTKTPKLAIDELPTPTRTEHCPPPPSIAPNDHPITNPAPTFSKDPSLAGTDAEPTIPTSSTADFAPGKRHRDPNAPPQPESFIYLDPDHPTLVAISAFYNLSPRFPRDRFFVRNPEGQPVKSIYYTSALAKDILDSNEGRGVKFVHAGVKMFVRQDVGLPKDPLQQNQLSDLERGKAWRIQNEGLGIVERWVGSGRVVKLWERPALRTLLREMFIKIEDGGSFTSLPASFRERLEGMSLGCCVLRCEPTDEAADEAKDEIHTITNYDIEKSHFDERHTLPLWRGHGSINLMLPKEERRAMLLRFFNESDAELVDNSKGGKKNQEVAEVVRYGDDLPPIGRREEDGEGRAGKADTISESDSEDGGVKLTDDGGPRHALEQTTEVAAAVEGESAVEAVQVEVDEKERARDASLQGQAQMDIDGKPADEGEHFNNTV